MEAPKYTAPPPDPTVTALGAKAQADDMSALQTTSQIDTASLMARYGTRLAMAGNTAASPLAVVPPPAKAA